MGQDKWQGQGAASVTNRGFPSKDFTLELSVCLRLYLMEGEAPPSPLHRPVWREPWCLEGKLEPQARRRLTRLGGGGHWAQKNEEDTECTARGSWEV